MRAVDVVQPDVCYVGGFTRALRGRRASRPRRVSRALRTPRITHSSSSSRCTCWPRSRTRARTSSSRSSRTPTIRGRPGCTSRGPRSSTGVVQVPDGPGLGCRDLAGLALAGAASDERPRVGLRESRRVRADARAAGDPGALPGVRGERDPPDRGGGRRSRHRDAMGDLEQGGCTRSHRVHAPRAPRRRRDGGLVHAGARAGGALLRLRRHRKPHHLQRLLRQAGARARRRGAGAALGRRRSPASARRSERLRAPSPVSAPTRRR